MVIPSLPLAPVVGLLVSSLLSPQSYFHTNIVITSIVVSISVVVVIIIIAALLHTTTRAARRSPSPPGAPHTCTPAAKAVADRRKL